MRFLKQKVHMHNIIKSKESSEQMKKNSIKTFLAGMLLALGVLAFFPAGHISAEINLNCSGGTVPDPYTGLCIKQNNAPGLLGAQSISEVMIIIINILLAIAAIIAVLFIVIGGYRYLFSAGNDEKAKEGQKTLVNAVIGLVIIILAYVIVTVVNNTISYGF